MCASFSGSQWTAYGGMETNPVLTSATFFEIASHHEFVVAQVILRWAMHLNVTVIPRSRDPRHILLNFNSLDIQLTANEIKLISEEWMAITSEEPSVQEEETDEDIEGDNVGLMGTSDDTGASEENLDERDYAGENGEEDGGLEKSFETEDGKDVDEIRKNEL